MLSLLDQFELPEFRKALKADCGMPLAEKTAGFHNEEKAR
jgi:hypothetical protein